MLTFFGLYLCECIINMFQKLYEIHRNLIVWNNIISHNSGYYLKMLHATEITKFSSQLCYHHNELSSDL